MRFGENNKTTFLSLVLKTTSIVRATIKAIGNHYFDTSTKYTIDSSLVYIQRKMINLKVFTTVLLLPLLAAAQTEIKYVQFEP